MKIRIKPTAFFCVHVDMQVEFYQFLFIGNNLLIENTKWDGKKKKLKQQINLQQPLEKHSIYLSREKLCTQFSHADLEILHLIQCVNTEQKNYSMDRRN